MARTYKPRERKPYIIVFWEGESEEEYMKFMRSEFHEYLNLTVHTKKGTFEMARKAFSGKGVYADDLSEVDAIWFIFDTEPVLREKWYEYLGILKQLRRKCKHADTRLLMTKGCIEYYLLLHFEKCAPLIVTPADKENIMQKLIGKYCADYAKGDSKSIYEIARYYPTAVENGEWSLRRIEQEISVTGDMDERDRRLFITDQTFSNVQEGIMYLMDLKKVYKEA